MKQQFAKKLLSLLICVVMLMGMVPAQAIGFAADAIYTAINGTANAGAQEASKQEYDIVIDIGEDKTYDFGKEYSAEMLAKGSFTSSNSDVLTVDSDGHATAHKEGEAEIQFTYEGVTKSWSVYVYDSTPTVPLSKVLENGILYVTLFNGERNAVIDTNDPQIEERIANGEYTSYLQTDKTVDLGEEIYVFIRMPGIIPNDGEEGIQEGVRYIMSLPYEIIAHKEDKNGKQVVNPDVPMEFFSVTGGIHAVGGIFGSDNNYRLEIAFENVADERNISGAFQYAAKVNDKLPPGSAQNPNFDPGGTLHFTTTPAPKEEEPEPDPDYTLTVECVESTADNHEFDWVVTISDLTDEAAIFPYRNLDLLLDEGMYFPANRSSMHPDSPYNDLRIEITYNDGSVYSPYYYQNNSSSLCFYVPYIDYDTKGQINWEDNTSKYSEYMNGYVLTRHVTVGLGAYSISSTTAPWVYGFATKIREIKFYFPAFVSDDWKLGNTGRGYNLTAKLTDSMNEKVYGDMVTVGDFSRSYSVGSPSLSEKVVSDSSSGQAYSSGMNGYYADYVSATLNTHSTGYDGNYFWIDVEPSYYNDLNVMYYMSNKSFNVEEGSSPKLVAASPKEATFKEFKLLNNEDETLETQWDFIGTQSPYAMKSTSGCSFGPIEGSSTFDVKLQYELTKIFGTTGEPAGNDLIIYRSRNKLKSNGKYVYILIDPGTSLYRTGGGTNSTNGWYEFIEACRYSQSDKRESAKAGQWRIHVINAPNCSIEASYDQVLGVLFNGKDYPSGGHVSDVVTLGVGPYNTKTSEWKGYTQGSYSYTYNPSAYMNGYWIDDSTIFWEFVIDERNYPTSGHGASLYIQPGYGLAVTGFGNGDYNIPGYPGNYPGVFLKKNGSWNQFGNTPNYYSGESAVPLTKISMGPHYLNSDNGSIYYYSYGASDLLNGKDSNGMLTLGFFTHAYSGYNPYLTCNAELVLQSGDISVLTDRLGYGASQSPLKIQASGSVPSPGLSKSGGVINHREDKDPAKLTADWSVYPTGLSSQRGSTAGSIVSANVGWYSGSLTVVDDMRSSYATDYAGNAVKVNPAQYTHITRMFTSTAYVAAVGSDSCSVEAIPYADSKEASGYKGYSGWQKYNTETGNWQYMGSSGVLWDPYNPGLYKVQLSTSSPYSSDMPLEVYVMYSGNMYTAVSSENLLVGEGSSRRTFLSAIAGQIGGNSYAYTDMASYSLSYPLVVQYRGIRSTPSLGPGVTYRTELDNEAFTTAARKGMADDESLSAVFNVSLKNGARLGTWGALGKSPAYTVVNAEVVAALSIQKGGAISYVDRYDPQRTGNYNLTITNGLSKADYITAEDYIVGFRSGNASYQLTDRDSPAAKALMSNLFIKNVSISEQAPNEEKSKNILIDGVWQEGWENSSISFHFDEGYTSKYGGSLFKVKFVKTDDQITEGTEFIIDYDLNLVMDTKNGGNLRLSDYNKGGYLKISNSAVASRPYEVLDDEEPEIIALAEGENEKQNPRSELNENPDGTHELTVHCAGEVDVNYLVDGNTLKLGTASVKNPKNPFGVDHFESEISTWTGSKGLKEEDSVTMSDMLKFKFTSLKYVENGKILEAFDLEDTDKANSMVRDMASIIRKYTSFKNFRIYYSETEMKAGDKWPEPTWAPGVTFTGIEPEKSAVYTDPETGIKFTLTYPQYSLGGYKENNEDKINNLYDLLGFTLLSENVPREEFIYCTYDIDIDWTAVFKEAEEKFGICQFKESLFNGLDTKGEYEDHASFTFGKAEIRESKVDKKVADYNTKEGTATWNITVDTGSTSSEKLEINDTATINIPKEAETRIKTAAEAATSIENIRITLNGDTIYDNGKYDFGWDKSNLTVEVDGLSIHVLIKNTDDKSVLDLNQQYVVTYDTVLDKEKFLENGGKAGDGYTIKNSASMHYGSFTLESSASHDFVPEAPITAEKTADGVDQYTAFWTAAANTGEAARPNFTLSDTVKAFDDNGLPADSFISIKDMVITVQIGDEEVTEYTVDSLPEGVTLTAQNGDDFVLGKNGVTGFKLVFDSLPAKTTVTVKYSTELDWETYKAVYAVFEDGLYKQKFNFTNSFRASSSDGYASAEKSASSSFTASSTFGKEGKLRYNADGTPLIDWDMLVNLNNSYDKETIEKFEFVEITDELNPVLGYVQGSVSLVDENGNAITNYDFALVGNTVIVTLYNPSEYPVFNLRFTTECYAAVDSITNEAQLSIDGMLAGNARSKSVDKVEAKGAFGVIRSTTTATFTPLASKYVDHELCNVDKAYTFQIIETDSNWNILDDPYTETVKNNAEGDIEFTLIRYEEAGTHYYLMQEIGGDVKDNRVFKIKVDVVETDEGFVVGSKIVAPENYQDIRFDNTDDDKVTDFTVTKVWDDNGNEAGARPERITVSLYQNGKPYNNMSVELSETNGWTYTWKNLPIAGGAYSAVEEEVKGYTGTYATENGETVITNKATVGSLTVRKTVVGTSGELDRDFNFTITLTDALGTDLTEAFTYVSNKLDAEGKPVTGTITSGQSFTLKHDEYITILYLPEGTKYKVVEDDANSNGYDTLAKNDNGNIVAGKDTQADFYNKHDTGNDHGNKKLIVKKTVTGVEGDALTEFNFKIILKDKYGFELTEQYDYVISKSNETFERGTLTSGATVQLKHNESIVISGLPEGTQYTVIEQEANQNGYVTTSTGATGTITESASAEASFVNSKGDEGDPKAAYVSVTVNKVWVGDNSESRPKEITVQLLKDGQVYDTVVLNIENSWKHTWKYLDREATWTVEEVGVPDGYRKNTTQNGNEWTITNTKITDFSVQKIWKDGNSVARPQGIFVQLYCDGTAYGEQVELNAANSWSYVWQGLDEAHTWTVKEVNVPTGYQSSVSNVGNNWTITNTKITDVSVTKVWKDSNNPNRPQSVTVQLYRNGEAFGETVELNTANSWSHVWKDLDANYVWTVKELNVPAGYSSVATNNGNAWTITNTLVTDVSVNKVWKDSNNPNRPQSVTVQLYRNGVAFGDTVELNAANSWSYVWKGLDANYTWTVKEVNVPAGYKSEASNNGNSWTITNTKVTDVSVNKVWKDSNNPNRPQSVTVQLYRNGEVYGETVELNAANGWSYTWKDLDANYTWTVKEVNVPNGYKSEASNNGNNWTITNTKITDVSVKKVWKDVNGQGRPQSVTVQLYKNGEAYGEAVELSAANNWSYIWKGLDANYTWTVKEVNVPAGYKSETTNDGDNWTITNTKLTDVSVKKVWKDNDNPNRPKSVTVQLYKNGEAYGEAVELSAANNWSYIWKDLDANYTWTVKEVNVPDGYKVEATHEGDNWTITNIKEEKKPEEKDNNTKSPVTGDKNILSLLLTMLLSGGAWLFMLFNFKRKRRNA